MVLLDLSWDSGVDPTPGRRELDLLTGALTESGGAGKSHRELEEMEEGIQAQLDGGDAADPEFLAAVLKRLTLAKAKARLREIHEDLLRKHLDRIVAAPDTAEDVAAAMGWADEDKVSASQQFSLGMHSSTAQTIATLLS